MLVEKLLIYYVIFINIIGINKYVVEGVQFLGHPLCFSMLLKMKLLLLF